MNLPSPLPDVSDDKWTKFVRTLMTAPISAVSPSNALGTFQMTPRRLKDLGVFEKLERTKSQKSGRTIWITKTPADHERATAFLKSLPTQYQLLTQSMKKYALKLRENGVKLPPDCTLSGALAIVHKAGLAGLEGERFPETEKIFRKANGIF